MCQATDNTLQTKSLSANKPTANSDREIVLSTGDLNVTKEDLNACLEKIQQHDESALSQFYDQTINNVYGLAFRITGKAEEAEEVVSDVYFQVWEQSARYQKHKGSIMTWLLTMCRSRAIDRIRKRQQSSAEISATDWLESVDLAARPDYLLSSTQQQSSIHQALKKLSSVQRQLLSLAFFRGLTYQEIADFIDMPLGTVKSHIRRSLIELKTEPTLQCCASSEQERFHD
jgi:RNA polymerase sigma-70 factor (ECF subfamily)